MSNKLIYFDNAATGFPKPGCVVREVVRAFAECGGNPGRSGHQLSVAASEAIYKCREEICELLNYDHPERVVFTPNATYALNIAVKGLARKNTHIIISDFEHNSVIRPVHALASDNDNGIEYSCFSASSERDCDIINGFLKELRPNTRLAVITYASNVCGRILPIEAIGEICKKRNIKLVVDGSQTCGEIPIDFKRIKADVICSAGHKGLYGPTGTGFAVFGENAEPKPLIQGGNGILSELPEMSGELPEVLEAGTLNTVGICGLAEGIRYIRKIGIESIHERAIQIANYIRDGLRENGATVYGDYERKIPIVLFNIPGKSSSEVSAYLDDKRICTRSGLHCAPLAHKALATGEGGAVRISLGYANTKSEADVFLTEIQKFAKGV